MERHFMNDIITERTPLHRHLWYQNERDVYDPLDAFKRVERPGKRKVALAVHRARPTDAGPGSIQSEGTVRAVDAAAD